VKRPIAAAGRRGGRAPGAGPFASASLPPHAVARVDFLRVRVAIFLGVLVAGIVSRVRYFDASIHDDAFISFRYARNLLRGAGLVMNPGERIEGYTNFLWTLVHAPIIAMGLDPAFMAQVLGAVLSLALIAGVYGFSECRLGGGWPALVAPVYLSWNQGFVLESLSGLETMAFATLVFASWAAFLEERRGSRLRPGFWAVPCGIATLVRPEGALVFALLVGWSLIGVARGEPASRLRGAVLMYAMLVVPFLIWRAAYYESWLPNTFYTKVGYTSAQVARGWRFLKNNFVYSTTAAVVWTAVGFTIAGCLRPVRAASVPPASATRWLAARPRDEALALALLLAAFYCLYVMLVGGDYEPTNRFQIPVLPLVYLLFQEGLRTFTLLVRSWLRVAAELATVLAVAASIACFWVSRQHFDHIMTQRRWPEARRNHHVQLRGVGTWLHDHMPPNTMIAVSSIGALSWFADRPILDMMGLTDRHIGRRRMPDMGKGPPGHEKGDGAYVLGRRPDVILFDKGHLFTAEVDRARVIEGARGVSELEIARAPDFERDYDLVRELTPVGVLHYFARRP